MAWRDSRSSRGRLLLYISSIVLGVAALVAVSSFGQNLLWEIDEQAKVLLGADLVISSRSRFTPEAEEFLRSLGGEQARQTSFSTMAFFPKSRGTRLVQVRALEGGFPFYGRLETDPPEAAQTFQSGRFALVEESLMLQYGVSTGDEIRLGRLGFQIAGILKRIPGETVNFSALGPRVFIPLRFVPETGLIQLGSRVRYLAFFKFSPSTSAETLVRELEPQLERLRLGSDTVQERKRELGRGVENAYRFLSLVGFVALLLGGVGVASSIHFYTRQRLSTVAVLRCLGATARQAFTVYLVQAAVLGFLGALAGAVLGIGVQFLLPWLLADLLAVEIGVRVSWTAVGLGILLGLGVAVLFSLLPLAPVRRIPPLLALRLDYEASYSLRRDPLVWILNLLIFSAVLLFALSQSSDWTTGLTFFGGLTLVFGLLFAVAKGITVLVRRYFPNSWTYVWRQGLANLYRPQNQTVVLMLVLGLGTFFIVTLYLAQETLLNQIRVLGSGDNPNLVLFDIQSDQKEAVRQQVQSFGLPVLEDVPVVTMRLEAVKGHSVQEIREDPNWSGRDWPLIREYRSTYRDHLFDTETVLAGSWPGAVRDGVAGVSLEERIARELQVTVGDELLFDVQGIPVPARVSSLRRVDWQRIQPNFFIVFPTGVLENAPQFHVLVTRVEDPETSARLQRAVVQDFPNVSALDLSLVLETVEGILGHVSFVIQFMALFSILTGLVVLVGAMTAARYQRMRESVLLRTLGASRRQIRSILLVEYLFLGLFAACTGLVLAVAAGWALAYFLFDAPFVATLTPAAALVVVVAVTVLVGALNSRGICDRPPLELLREAV